MCILTIITRLEIKHNNGQCGHFFKIALIVTQVEINLTSLIRTLIILMQVSITCKCKKYKLFTSPGVILLFQNTIERQAVCICRSIQRTDR